MKVIQHLAILLVLISGNLYGQESVIWATEVIDVSSEFSHLEFSAIQALHKPNVYPVGAANPNAWRPKNENKSEFIVVGFATPVKARQVAIAETENPGAVKRIISYDKDFNEFTLFEITPREIPIESRLLNIFFEETTYEIYAIGVEIEGSAVAGYNSIDAIGISNSNLPINVLIQVAGGVANKVAAESLGENVNSEYVEHSPIVSPDGKRLYFSRQYHPQNAGGVDDPEDIWMSELDEETGKWLPAKNIGPPLNTPGPNFISTISIADGKEQLILGNKYGKKGRMFNGTSTAYYTENGYTDPEAIEIENDYNYSNKSDYFLLPGGEQMLLSVERDDSYGGRDLYISKKNGKVWSEPKNLGGDINTVAEEAAPFLSEDNKTLYFSSGGYSGYGGMDVYVSRRLDNSWGKWSPPDNLGSGINTDLDDLYFSIPSSGQHVYFTRGKVDEDTDIFRFKVDDFFIDPESAIASSVRHLIESNKEEEIIIITVRGRVINNKTSEPISGANVIVERLPDGVEIGKVKSKEGGEYMFSLRPGARFGITVDVDGFISQSENLDLNKTKKADTIELDMQLFPIEVGQPIVLNNIFFAFNKDQLTTASYSELGRVLEYLVSGRINKIEISGHTDSIGEEVYNMNLSERRAKSVYQYFLDNGVNASKLESKGYGESAPVDTNDTPEGRFRNRRVEFKVLEAG